MNSGAVVAGVLLLPDNRANIVTSVDGYGRKDGRLRSLSPLWQVHGRGIKMSRKKMRGTFLYL